MADTNQIVIWSLDYTCPLRTPETLGCAESAYNCTDTARYVTKTHSNGFGLYADVCVTGYGLAGQPADLPEPHLYPASGFLVPAALESIGGHDGLRALCSSCPANHSEQSAANCAGTFYEDPDSEALENQLSRIVSRLNLIKDYCDHIHSTNPHWYGMWAQSPLSPQALAVLTRVLQEKLNEDTARATNRRDQWQMERNEALAKFVRAAVRAMQLQLPMNVHLCPPGHTDFGIETVFPHCQFCKATVNEHARGKSNCMVCNRKFNDLSYGATSRPMQSRNDDLRTILGPERFRDFAKNYLMKAGVKERDAIVIVNHTELQEEERMRSWQTQKS